MSILEKLMAEIQSSTANSYSLEERLQIECDTMNQAKGSFTELDCPICKNKGMVYFVEDGYVKSAWCQCAARRQTLARIQKSGLQDLYDACSLEAFRTDEPWQARMAQIAREFLAAPQGAWLYAGGQVGAGKTHLCTAVVRELLDRGKNASYVLWNTEEAKLRALQFDDAAYNAEMDRLKQVEVLYIDDFCRGKLGTVEARIAFELINYRYLNRRLVTILSSERTLQELADLDEAIGSRIMERAKGFCIGIKRDPSRNFRLRE